MISTTSSGADGSCRHGALWHHALHQARAPRGRSGPVDSRQQGPGPAGPPCWRWWTGWRKPLWSPENRRSSSPTGTAWRTQNSWPGRSAAASVRRISDQLCGAGHRQPLRPRHMALSLSARSGKPRGDVHPTGIPFHISNERAAADAAADLLLGGSMYALAGTAH